MCEVLVVVADKVLSDPFSDAKAYKRGWVIAVCEDGWPWSVKECTNPNWQIFRLPNVSVVQAQSLLAEEADTDPANPSPVLRRRGFRLDLDSAAVSTQLLKQERSAKGSSSIVTVPITVAELIAVTVRNPPLPNPLVM